MKDKIILIYPKARTGTIIIEIKEFGIKKVNETELNI